MVSVSHFRRGRPPRSIPLILADRYSPILTIVMAAIATSDSTFLGSYPSILQPFSSERPTSSITTPDMFLILSYVNCNWRQPSLCRRCHFLTATPLAQSGLFTPDHIHLAPTLCLPVHIPPPRVCDPASPPSLGARPGQVYSV